MHLHSTTSFHVSHRDNFTFTVILAVLPTDHFIHTSAEVLGSNATSLKQHSKVYGVWGKKSKWSLLTEIRIFRGITVIC
jgi:hypothetical protein